MFMSTEFKSLLEAVEASGESVVIRFRADNGGIITLKGSISELSVSEVQGYIKTNNGARIQLDKLVEVDGMPVSYIA
jgi:hypothetical protein